MGEEQSNIEDGVQKRHFDNGNVEFEGEYKDGKPVGTHKTYYEDGSIKEEMIYEGGKPYRKREYDEIGNLLLEEDYEETII